MKKPKKQSKALKTVSILLGALLIFTVCLFVMLLVFISGFKGFVEKILNQIPPVTSYTPPVSESASESGESTSDTAAQTSVSLTDTTSDDEVIDTSKRYDHSSLNKDIDKLAALYPEIISASTVGNSVNGRNIRLLKVGKGDKKVFACAAIHAREIITSKYIMLCVFEYCKAYNSKSGRYGSYNVKKLLDEYTLYIVPCANPDGMEIVSNRKVPNASIKDFSRYDYKANTNGVDLNRNFPLAWEQIDNGVTKPANEAYKGKTAGSEPETECLMSLCESNIYEFALSFHIKGECVFWGDTYDTSHNIRYRQFAKKLADLTDFYLPPASSDVNAYGGGFENWFRHTYKKPGFCVELVSYQYTTSPTDNKDYEDFHGTVNWSVSKYILLEAIS